MLIYFITLCPGLMPNGWHQRHAQIEWDQLGSSWTTLNQNGCDLLGTSYAPVSKILSVKCNSEILTQEAKNSILSSVLFFSFLAGWFDAFLGGAQGQTQCTVGFFDKYGALKVCIYYFNVFIFIELVQTRKDILTKKGWHYNFMNAQNIIPALSIVQWW